MSLFLVAELQNSAHRFKYVHKPNPNQLYMSVLDVPYCPKAFLLLRCTWPPCPRCSVHSVSLHPQAGHCAISMPASSTLRGARASSSATEQPSGLQSSGCEGSWDPSTIFSCHLFN